MNPYFELFKIHKRKPVTVDNSFYQLLKFSQQHCDNNINEQFTFMHSSNVYCTTLAEIFLEFFPFCDKQDILSLIDLFDYNKTTQVYKSKKYLQSQFLTEQEFSNFLENTENQLEAVTKLSVAYALFNIPLNNYNRDNTTFTLIFEEILKKFPIDKNVLLQHHSNFLTDLIESDNFEILNLLEKKLSLTLNDYIQKHSEKQPLYFYVRSLNGIDHILEKEVDFNLKNNKDNIFLEYISKKEYGKTFLKHINSKKDIDLEKYLIQFLEQKKTINEIKDLFNKIAQKQKTKDKSLITLKGKTVLYQAIHCHHLKYARSFFNSLSDAEAQSIINKDSQIQCLLGKLLSLNLDTYTSLDRKGVNRIHFFDKFYKNTDFQKIFDTSTGQKNFLKDILASNFDFLEDSILPYTQSQKFTPNKKILNDIVEQTKQWPIFDYRSYSDRKINKITFYSMFIEHFDKLQQSEVIELIKKEFINDFKCENTTVLFYHIQNYIDKEGQNDIVDFIIDSINQSNDKDASKISYKIRYIHFLNFLDIDINEKQHDELKKFLSHPDIDPKERNKLEVKLLKQFMSYTLKQTNTTTLNPKKINKL